MSDTPKAFYRITPSGDDGTIWEFFNYPEVGITIYPDGVFVLMAPEVDNPGQSFYTTNEDSIKELRQQRDALREALEDVIRLEEDEREFSMDDHEYQDWIIEHRDRLESARALLKTHETK